MWLWSFCDCCQTHRSIPCGGQWHWSRWSSDPGVRLHLTRMRNNLKNNHHIFNFCINIHLLYFSCCCCHKNELWTERLGAFALRHREYDWFSTRSMGPHPSRRHVLWWSFGRRLASVAPDVHCDAWHAGAHRWPRTSSVWEPWRQETITWAGTLWVTGLGQRRELWTN